MKKNYETYVEHLLGDALESWNMKNELHKDHSKAWVVVDSFDEVNQIGTWFTAQVRDFKISVLFIIFNWKPVYDEAGEEVGYMVWLEGKKTPTKNLKRK